MRMMLAETMANVLILSAKLKNRLVHPTREVLLRLMAPLANSHLVRWLLHLNTLIITSICKLPSSMSIRETANQTYFRITSKI